MLLEAVALRAIDAAAFSLGASCTSRHAKFGEMLRYAWSLADPTRQTSGHNHGGDRAGGAACMAATASPGTR